MLRKWFENRARKKRFIEILDCLHPVEGRNLATVHKRIHANRKLIHNSKTTPANIISHDLDELEKMGYAKAAVVELPYVEINAHGISVDTTSAVTMWTLTRYGLGHRIKSEKSSTSSTQIPSLIGT